MKYWRQLGSLFVCLVVPGVLAVPGLAQSDAKPAKAQPSKATEPPTWVELGENGAIIARQVLEYQKGQHKPKCPSVHISKEQSVAMAERGGLPKDFGKVVVCEAVIPSGTTSASIKKIPLRLPSSSISKIVLVGDTGCKGIVPTTAKATPFKDPDDEEEAEQAAPAAAKKAKKTQKCKGTHWPLANVAEYARKQHPDLVIHVGDYVYVREDTWENWKVQFFQPAQPLLLAAPWIFVRGNHENCTFHGNGFFYLLDPRAPSSCPDPPQTVPSCPKDNVGDSTSPYVVKVGGSQFVVMDSSGANCDFANNESGACKPGCFPYEVKTWKDLFSQANQLLGSGNAFLLTHRPLWGLKSGTSSPPPPAPSCPGAKGETAVAINSTLQAAYEQSGMKGINMVLSGHIHNFQLITYNPTSGISPQPQFVVGDSGVELSTPPPPGSTVCNVIAQNGSLQRSNFFSGKEFGFGVLTSDASKFDLYLPSGDLGLNCTIVNNTANCVPPATKKKGADAASAKKKIALYPKRHPNNF